jgi:hypothetical protein
MSIKWIPGGGHFNWWRKQEYPGKTTDQQRDTDKTLSHNVVLSTPRYERDYNLQR